MFSIFDYLMELSRRNPQMPWRHVKQWQPFKIDALGLVTLLGADEVNRNVGMLQRRRFTEYLPLLAAFVIAGDTFSDEQAGFAIYNVTDGIHSTELKGWFSRWLMSQKVNNATTIFRWDLKEKKRLSRTKTYLAPLISFICVAPLLACTIVIGDWFGVGNSVAIIVSIFVRVFLLWQRRQSINDHASPPKYRPSLPEQESLPFHHNGHNEKQGGPGLSPSASIKQRHRAASQPQANESVKLLVTRADGRMVTIYVRRSILFTFIKDSEPKHPKFYSVARWIGWAAFGAHICVLGMSSLFTQIYTVVLLVLSTWILCHGFDADIGRVRSEQQSEDGTRSEFVDASFTSHLTVSQENPRVDDDTKKLDRRMIAYVRLEPTERQERMMRHWSLLPFEEQSGWYEEYEQEKTKYQASKAAASGRLSKVATVNVQQTSSSNVSTVSSEPVVMGAIQLSP